MRIGIPKEIKIKENRVSCTPGGARMLVRSGHEVRVQQGAGDGAGYRDAEFTEVGATVVPDAAAAWDAELVIKVKEPQPEEYPRLRPDLLLFTYLHLAAAPDLTRALMESGVTAIAYETVQHQRNLPLLEPMSEIAGRMSTLVGAYYLGKPRGGRGILLGGVPGVLPGKVMVIGGGTAGINAGRVAMGLGADVTILEVDLEKMRFLDITLHSAAHTLFSNEQNIIGLLPSIDLLIGAVLVPGAAAPKLITREMLRTMAPGSVFVDIAIDQGGCSETSRPTDHDNPVYVDEEVVHYCVANMPGAYARTATQALTNATLPYAKAIADLGFEGSLRKHPELVSGVNIHQGGVTCEPVAHDLRLPMTPLELSE